MQYTQLHILIMFNNWSPVIGGGINGNINYNDYHSDKYSDAAKEVK